MLHYIYMNEFHCKTSQAPATKSSLQSSFRQQEETHLPMLLIFRADCAIVASHSQQKLNVHQCPTLCSNMPIIPLLQHTPTKKDTERAFQDFHMTHKQLIWSSFTSFVAMCCSTCDDIRHSEAAPQLQMLLLQPTTSGVSWLEAAQHRRCRESGHPQREMASLHCQRNNSTDCFCKSWQCSHFAKEPKASANVTQ